MAVQSKCEAIAVVSKPLREKIVQDLRSLVVGCYEVGELRDIPAGAGPGISASDLLI